MRPLHICICSHGGGCVWKNNLIFHKFMIPDHNTLLFLLTLVVVHFLLMFIRLKSERCRYRQEEHIPGRASRKIEKVMHCLHPTLRASMKQICPSANKGVRRRRWRLFFSRRMSIVRAAVTQYKKYDYNNNNGKE